MEDFNWILSFCVSVIAFLAHFINNIFFRKNYERKIEVLQKQKEFLFNHNKEILENCKDIQKLNASLINSNEILMQAVDEEYEKIRTI